MTHLGLCNQHLYRFPPCRCGFKDLMSPSTGVSSIRSRLRGCAGLPGEGPAKDVKVWRESGPNHAPVWKEVRLDWSVKTCGELGLSHGDVVVVQEHPDRLPDKLPHARTGPEWFRTNAPVM